MAYVCDQLAADGSGTCVQWVVFNPLSGLAITHAQMLQIGGGLFTVAGIFIAYAIIASAVNKL